MASYKELVGFLNRRRAELGLSYHDLAKRSGLAVLTVRRILAGSQPSASLSSVLAMAQVMGVRLSFEAESDADTFLERQALAKAEHLVGMVHASSALEGQGLDRHTRAKMVRRTVHELLAGSKRRLWAAQ